MLTISRPDVECDFIQEFPADERFIKLPIQRYLELLGLWDTVNRPQVALINAINNPKYRFVCAALARRLGKTYISNIIAQLVILIPGCNVLIMSPNYNLSSISFELQRKLINTFDLEIKRDNLKDKIIELSNGSTVRMGSIGQVDSCVGRSYTLILFDEAALNADGKDAFNVALRPTLDRPNAKAIFISTPRGKKNWFSEFFDRGKSDEYPQWCSIHADYTENTRMAESDVDEARKSMSKAEFEQEYMASFNSFEGRIFDLDPSDIVTEIENMDNMEFFAGLDPGYKDPTGFLVIGYSPVTDCFYVMDDYLQAGEVTSTHAEAFRELIDKWNVEITFVDPAAAQFAADLAYIYDISTTKAKKQTLESIAYVQTLLAQHRLKVFAHCQETIDALDQYQWDTRSTITTEKPLHNNASHIADALRYALYTYQL